MGLLREAAEANPDRLACVCGDQYLTYKDVNVRSQALAALLESHDVGSGSPIVYIGENCHRMLLLLLAASSLDAIFIPLGTRVSTAELMAALRHVRPAAVTYRHWQGLSEPVRDVICEWSGAGRSLIAAIDDENLQLVAGPCDSAPHEGLHDPFTPSRPAENLLGLPVAAPDGPPRIAAFNEDALVIHSLQLLAAKVIHPQPVYLNVAPNYHAGGLQYLLATYVSGGTNVFVRDAAPKTIMAAVADHRCEVALLATPTIDKIVESARTLNSQCDLSSLVESVGTPSNEAMTAEWLALTSCTARSPKSMIGYGKTETLGYATYDDGKQLGNVGAPLAGVHVAIVGEDGKQLEAGEKGEIAVEGPQVMQGYLDKYRRATREHLFRTGDWGRREKDGSVSFLGPRIEIIRTGLENVYPAEVESVLASHPSVSDSCVVGLPDPVWGQSVFAAVVKESTGSDVSPDALIDFVAAQIARHKKPRGILIVDRLPTLEGKTDREKVRAVLMERFESSALADTARGV